MTSEQNEPANSEPAGPDAVSETSSTESTADDSAAESTRKLSRKQRRAQRKAAKAQAASDDSRTDADDSDSGDRHWAASLALATGVAALAGAVACLGWFGYTGVSAYVVENSKAAKIRNQSIDAAEQAILNVTNIDVNDIDGWEKRLQSSLTGEALEQTQDGQVTALKQEIADGRRSQTAELTAVIRRAAATEVNVDENRATVLVFSTSTAKGEGDQPGESVPMEFLVTVVESDGVRKADKIVALSGIRYTDGTQEGGR